MSTKTQENKECVASATELFIGMCKVMAAMLSQLPEEDQSDMIEVLHAMSHSRKAEEIAEAEQTIREILNPQVGHIIAMPTLSTARDAKVKKWSEYVGSKIKDLRKDAGLTQEELAKKADLPQPHISRIENAEISPTRMTLEKIAKALGKPISSLDPSV